VLFSVIVANYPDRAWKSKKHHDGTMYDNMFIVGIDTPDGQATYHYDIDPYWDMFKCRVLDNAPEWDGHTPAQAIERIGKLKAQEPPTSESISSAIECLLHPQDADDSDMAKAIDTAVHAMRLMKAQEPRILTVSEIGELVNGDVVWVEFTDGRLLPMMVEDGCLMRWRYLWRICEDAFYDEDYKARAWTSRPTAEQREAIPWLT
jgi:hypothetical protein